MRYCEQSVSFHSACRNKQVKIVIDQSQPRTLHLSSEGNKPEATVSPASVCSLLPSWVPLLKSLCRWSLRKPACLSGASSSLCPCVCASVVLTAQPLKDEAGVPVVTRGHRPDMETWILTTLESCPLSAQGVGPQARPLPSLCSVKAMGPKLSPELI